MKLRPESRARPPRAPQSYDAASLESIASALTAVAALIVTAESGRYTSVSDLLQYVVVRNSTGHDHEWPNSKWRPRPLRELTNPGLADITRSRRIKR